MIQVRQGVFETNSSSTHAIAICSEQEWNDLKAGKLLVNRWDITDMKTPDNAVSDDDECQYLTWDEFYDDCSYEFYNRHFTTPSGDKMVAWGYYGYD